MRHVLLYSLSLLLCSCVVGSEITVHPDNSATVTQNYLESPSYPEYKQYSLGFRDTREERKKYDTPTISNFKDIYGAMFSFDITTIDSLPNYLSGFPDNCLRINTFGDSLFVFRVSPAEEKPKAFYDYYFQFTFDLPVKAVSSSKKSRIYYKPKKEPNQVAVGVFHKKLWKKNRDILMVVELDKPKP